MSKTTALTVSNSMRSCFKRCPRQFDYRYNKRLVPKRQAPALQLGSLVHEALAALYDPEYVGDDRAGHAMEVFQKGVDECAVKIAAQMGDMERFNKDMHMGAQMMKHYIEEVWPHDDFKVISVEQRFEVRVKNPDGKPTHTKFIGYIDGIVERNGNLYILEHKTAKDLNVNHLILDGQITDYCWAMRELGTPVVGVYYNILRKVDAYSGRTKAPYHYREAVYRSDAELDERGAELYEEAKAIRQMGHYYRNPTRDCAWDCSYRQMCIAELGYGDGSSLMDTVYEVEDRKR